MSEYRIVEYNTFGNVNNTGSYMTLYDLITDDLDLKKLIRFLEEEEENDG